MSAFAFRFPLAVILDMLGLPQADLDRIKRWTDDAVALLNGVGSPQELMTLGMSGVQFYGYVVEKCRAALVDPGDNLLGELASRTGDASDDVLSFDEFASTVLQLIIAGSESSASTIGSAVLRLARDLETQDRLRRHPELVPAFLEETLRLDSPFQGHFRLVTRDTELAGVPLAKGTRLMLLWASANRDEAEFTDPDRQMPERDNARQHLAFGHGIHHCLGAPLARMEGKVALERWLARTRSFSFPADATPSYVNSVFVRTLRTLSLSVTPA